MSKFYSVKVKKVKKLTQDSVEISFVLTNDLNEKFKYISGQYITISKEINGEEVRRAYSICSDSSSDELSIGVKKVDGGKMSTFLTSNVHVGDTLDIMPPQGNFVLNNERKVVCICAGSGITPILSMIKSNSHDFTLIYGNKTQDSTMFLDEIEKINIKKYFTYSREKVDNCFNSRINKEFLKELSVKENILNADGYYICGPGDMIDNVEDFLINNNIDKSQIHFELFAPKQDTKLLDQKAENQEIVSDITVIIDGDEFEYSLHSNGETILDSAMNEGADVPYSCKGGVCCTCKAKIIEGKATMTENFSLSEDEVDDGFILTCMAHPASERIIVDFDEMF